MCSLANYTFTALPEAGLSFEELMKGLIQSEVATPLLRLPGAGRARWRRARWRTGWRRAMCR
jgi:hypothetical protein